jgi:Fic family protein
MSQRMRRSRSRAVTPRQTLTDAGRMALSCYARAMDHVEQARRRLEQIAEAGARWSILEGLVARRGWPDRLVIALEQSVFQGVDRASYAAEADVSAPTASNDSRRLVDGGLVARRGKGRTTRYVASDELRRVVRDRLGVQRG